MIAYKQLEQHFEKILHIDNSINILYWDLVNTTPVGSRSYRQKEISSLVALSSELLTSDFTLQLIKDSDQILSQLDLWQVANLNQIKKKYYNSVCVSKDLQKQYFVACSESEFIWTKAKREGSYDEFKPYLNRVFTILKEIAELKKEHLQKSSAYEVEIDQYDPDRSLSEVRSIFSTIKSELPGLVSNIIKRQQAEQINNISLSISIDQQKKLVTKMLKDFGFNLDQGRVDKGIHPCCIGAPGDIRILTQFDQNNFLNTILALVHEVGHALYEQSLPTKYQNQPVGRAQGMAVHESQSLIMENHVLKSREFMAYLARLLRDELGITEKGYDAENLFKIITRVKRSNIRIEADEVTYFLHQLIRFEIEEDIFNGHINVDMLPECWNSKMKEYLAIVPSDVREGCIQDIHWSKGKLGYFPAYVTGAIMAAMMMNQIKVTNPDIMNEIAKGKFDNMNNFLDNKVRKYGSLKSSEEILVMATGKSKVQPIDLIQYLKDKYLS